MCLAASNPEGRFYGVMPTLAEATEANAIALMRQVANVTFLAGTPSQVSSQLPMLDVLVAEDLAAPLAAADRAMMFVLAEQRLAPSGLFAMRYRAYAKVEDTLRFLVREFAPEMNVVQAREFLDEIKALGALYFAGHPEDAAVLEQAIAENLPDLFFARFLAGEAAASGTLEVMEGLLPRGFAYVGDAEVGVNYVELAAPVAAHEVLASCREHLLFEPIKDFTLQRLERNDVWCRLPAAQTNDMAQLFGRFTYGITVPRDQIPASVKSLGWDVDLTEPLYVKLIELMTLLPMGVGDFLAHPSGKGEDAAEVLNAVQMLVALGLARPMRGHYAGRVEAQSGHPKWAAGYNSHLNETPIRTGKVLLASPVVGDALAIPARDALVIQALHRVGMENSASALLAELICIAANPALAAQIMDVAEPTSEIARNMIQDVVSRSLVRWYAYGVLAA